MPYRKRALNVAENNSNAQRTAQGKD